MWTVAFRNRLPTPSALILVLSLGCSSSEAPRGAPQAMPVAASAPSKADWKPVFVDLGGNELRPADDPATKAITLVFVLRDCPIANGYIPELNRLHEKFSGRGACLLLVHADSDTLVEEAHKHASEYQIKWPIVLDPRHEWVKAAGATMSPEAVVFSPVGKIVYRGRIDDQYIGLGKRRAVVTSHDLHDALEAALAGQPVAQPRTQAVGCLIPKLTSGE